MTGSEISSALNIVTGYFSEFVHLPVTMPLETVMIIFQTNASEKVLTPIVACRMSQHQLIPFCLGFPFAACRQSGMEVLNEKFQREGYLSVYVFF
jgi:hypothetical protein